MKSLQELEAIRKKTLENINLRKDHNGTRVVVGMATCGIAAGARPVLAAFMDEVAEVYKPGEEKVTYVKVNPDMVPRIVTEHIVNGRAVDEYTIGHYEANHK